MVFNELVKEIAHMERNSEKIISSISRDSRTVTPGCCFVACKGSKYDGAKFIENAINKGAVAVVTSKEIKVNGNVGFATTDDINDTWALMASRWHGNPTENIKLVGVTGTNGKTTITYLLESIFECANLTPGVIGTVEYRWCGNKKAAERTTPDAYLLQSMFSQMKKDNVKAVVMEVSSHAIDQKRISGCKFNGAIFTNLSPEHLDYHSNMEEYFESKAKLFEETLPNSGNGFAVVNADDDYGKRLMDVPSGIDLWSYSLNGEARVKGNLEITDNNLILNIKTKNNDFTINSKMIGKFNAYNILAAVASALAMGIDEKIIIQGVEKVKNVPGRAERIDNNKGITAIVDYAHTPDALLNVLKQMRPLTKGRLIVVFGCGGDRDKEKRRPMGEIAATLSDYAIVTDDNPRTEKPENIRNEIFKGVKSVDETKAEIIGDRKKAILKAISLANPGDSVIIAGKGHENYQEINGKKYPFDDRKILEKALND